ncbi:hypothetical protein Trco_007664, partial [Trichoderma cornu-damae]
RPGAAGDMAVSISEAQVELINSLAPDDIPHKLRCANCSKLAVNALRLPCCEQAICETCHSNLPQSCPVCEHSPLSAADCNPNKSLRTTIRVFLRTAEKKREASRPKESNESAPPTPVDTRKPSLPDLGASAGGPTEKAADASGGVSIRDTAPRSADEPAAGRQEDKQQEVVLSSAEGTLKEQPQLQPHAAEAREADGPADGGHGAANNQDRDAAAEGDDGADQAGNSQEQYCGPDVANGGFQQNMMFPGGDFGQMQMMMAMQNGMGPNSFSGFPMMVGMPGMGMDPMQNMYMNGGFQGMGMNGMGGFGGGFGQGSNDNWNGAQSWNFDQNNYNQNGPGMGTGDFGNFNTGFQTGYNQGNYGHFNDYRRNNYGRGRGRGRGFYGGYGRGGHHQHGGAMNNYHDQGQHPQYGQGQGAAAFQTQGDAGQQQATATAASAQTDEKANEGASQAKAADVQSGGGNTDGAGQDPSESASRETLGNEALPGGALCSAVAQPPDGPSMQNRSGAGAIRSILTAPDAPINAPKGPKAMRQGLPNTSLLNLRARGFQIEDSGLPVQKPAAVMSQPPQASPSNPATQPGSRSSTPNLDKVRDRDPHRDRSKERPKDHDKRDTGGVSEESHDAQERDRDRERVDRDRGRETERSRSRISSRSRSLDRGSRSPSRSRGHRSSHRRPRRQRSESAGEEDKDDSHRRRKHRSSRRHYHDGDDEQPAQRSKDDKAAERSRSASPDDAKRSSHRSRKDKDKDRDYERRKDKHRGEEEDDRQRSNHRSSHRERGDYERSSSRRHDKERERDKDGSSSRKEKDRKDRYRDRDRDRDRDYSGRHGSGARKHSVDGTATPSGGDKGFDPPTGPRGFDIKGGSRAAGTASAPQKDAHTLEREARNRERLLKEAQRMAGLAGLAGSKRSRDDVDDGGRKGRRSRRSDVVDGDGEERMRRLEAEREGGRWG